MPADSHTDVGFCSQIAVFKRNLSHQDSTVQCHSREEPTVYKLVRIYTGTDWPSGIMGTFLVD